MSRYATKACFPRDHQTPGENALYNKMYSASKKSGVYYSDDRRDAKFHSQKSGGESGKKVSKNTIAAWRHGLEKKGWIERIDGGPRHRNPLTGMWASIEYRVLTHAEWVENYPSRCNSHAAVQTRPQEVPRSDGDKGCDRTQSQGPEPDPIIGSGPDPINPQYRTQPLGHKEKLKEKRESRKNRKPPSHFF